MKSIIVHTKLRNHCIEKNSNGKHDLCLLNVAISEQMKGLLYYAMFYISGSLNMEYAVPPCARNGLGYNVTADNLILEISSIYDKIIRLS